MLKIIEVVKVFILKNIQVPCVMRNNLNVEALN